MVNACVFSQQKVSREAALKNNENYYFISVIPVLPALTAKLSSVCYFIFSSGLFASKEIMWKAPDLIGRWNEQVKCIEMFQMIKAVLVFRSFKQKNLTLSLFRCYNICYHRKPDTDIYIQDCNSLPLSHIDFIQKWNSLLLFSAKYHLSCLWGKKYI